ncbi:MAG TPA: FAD-dependent oxidoreductase, partial [Ktedonobacterales bacterium]|nr:FAD-dependent oxidoreductase [Ktedonobacterales bacterium]
MRPQATNTAAPLTASSSPAPLPHAPWAADISPTVQRELTLPGVAELPAYTVDVAVIGAGVAGLSAAIGARQAGATVAVFEAAPRIGAGATGRNAGILSAGVNLALADVPTEDDELRAMWPATNQLLLSLVEESRLPGALVAASLTGSLSLAERPGAARHLAAEAKARVAVGMRAELWTPAQVAEKTSGRLNTSTVLAALWMPDEGRIQPLTLLAHLARQARAAGVSLVGGA